MRWVYAQSTIQAQRTFVLALVLGAYQRITKKLIIGKINSIGNNTSMSADYRIVQSPMKNAWLFQRITCRK